METETAVRTIRYDTADNENTQQKYSICERPWYEYCENNTTLQERSNYFMRPLTYSYSFNKTANEYRLYS